MLAIGPNADSDFGLSPTPVSDHSYATIDELCKVVDKCDAISASHVAELRATLGKGGHYSTQISEESAVCMGFKV